MNLFAAVLLFASAALADPDPSPLFLKIVHEKKQTNKKTLPKASLKSNPKFHQQGFGHNAGYGNYNSLPSLSSFRNANNFLGNVAYQPSRSINPGFNNINPSRSIETGFGSFPDQGISPDQRATYLPVMRALLRVMESSRPSVQDVNNLMVLTRDLNRKVPKNQNLLGNFNNFGIDNLESMGLPETGDIITTVNGVPSIQTTFGVFPLSDTNLMTSQERAQFLPIVRTFTRVLEKGSADANESQLLLQQASQLTNLIPGNLRSSIQQLTGNINPGRSFNY